VTIVIELFWMLIIVIAGFVGMTFFQLAE